MIGQRIGNYRIARLLGSGGMGSVYEAVQDQIQQRVAIKVLHPQFSTDPHISTRFLNEALSVNVVRHPGLVSISDHGRLPDGSAYLIMEFLEGQSLRDRLQKRGPLGLDALRLVRQMASALAAAHEKGVIHRDLKPENVMLVPDPDVAGGERTKIVDFGIAKVAPQHQDGAARPTRTGLIMGTATYMSPEQCHGANRVEARSDVYSLGIMLYELLCGGPPFTSEGHGQIMAMHQLSPPPPLRQFAPHIPVEVAAFVHRMIAKTPEERPTMEAVKAQLGDWIQKPPPAPSPSSPKGTEVLEPSVSTTFTGATGERRPPDQPSRGRWLIPLAVLGLLGVGGGTAYLIGAPMTGASPPDLVVLPPPPLPDLRPPWAPDLTLPTIADLAPAAMPDLASPKSKTPRKRHGAEAAPSRGPTAQPPPAPPKIEDFEENSGETKSK